MNAKEFSVLNQFFAKAMVRCGRTIYFTFSILNVEIKITAAILNFSIDRCSVVDHSGTNTPGNVK